MRSKRLNLGEQVTISKDVFPQTLSRSMIPALHPHPFVVQHLGQVQFVGHLQGLLPQVQGLHPQVQGFLQSQLQGAGVSQAGLQVSVEQVGQAHVGQASLQAGLAISQQFGQGVFVKGQVGVLTLQEQAGQEIACGAVMF